MRCKFCGYLDTHGDDCPRNLPDADEQYNAGWNDGRVYKETDNNHPAYRAGRYRGEIAAEYAANVSYYDYYDPE